MGTRTREKEKGYDGLTKESKHEGRVGQSRQARASTHGKIQARTKKRRERLREGIARQHMESNGATRARRDKTSNEERNRADW